MQKISNLKGKLLMTAGYIAILCVLGYFSVPCVYLQFLHIPCPGCGMSRAVLSALQFDFISAFEHHGMFWSVPIAYIYFLFDGKVFNKKIIDNTVLISIAVGFAIVWIIKIFTHMS